MITHQNYDVRQSGRVLELQNRDLRIRPTDLSLHFPILVTIRELPFRKYRGRSPAKWKAREDKIEEAKKQKNQEWNSSRWKSSSWTWTTAFSSLPGEIRRVSVPIGNHQPIGAAQTKRVRVPLGR